MAKAKPGNGGNAARKPSKSRGTTRYEDGSGRTGVPKRGSVRLNNRSGSRSTSRRSGRG